MIMIYGTSILTSSLLSFSLSTFSVESDCVAVPCVAKITMVNKCTHKNRQMEFKTLIITDVRMHTYKYDWVWENQSMSVQELKSILLLDITAALVTLLCTDKIANYGQVCFYKRLVYDHVDMQLQATHLVLSSETVVRY